MGKNQRFVAAKKKRDDPLKISAIPLTAFCGYCVRGWRDVPERYGKWNTIYKCFAHWSNLRIFEKLSSESDFSELWQKAHKAAAGAF